MDSLWSQSVCMCVCVYVCVCVGVRVFVYVRVCSRTMHVGTRIYFVTSTILICEAVSPFEVYYSTIYHYLFTITVLHKRSYQGLDSMPDDIILVLVARPLYQGLGLKTWLPRSCFFSRNLVTNVLVLTTRTDDKGFCLGLKFFFKGLIISLYVINTELNGHSKMGHCPANWNATLLLLI